MGLIEVTPLPEPPANTGGGSSKKAFGNVIFQPDAGGQIFLKLDGPWKIGVGLKPDINHGVVSYLEADKLPKDPNVSGKILLCYNAAASADVTIEKVKLIAIESVDQRNTADKGVITTEYRLFFSDFREQYIEPRGGRLEYGPMNLGPNPKWGTGTNASIGVSNPAGGPAQTTAPEVDLKTLIQHCLDAMGITSASPPGSVSNYDAPRDLKWDGNHAPTELAKLLALCGVAFIPGFDGKPTLEEITTDGNPSIPKGEALPDQKIPAIDRRGAVVVFSSYPNRQVATETSKGPSPDSFYFVCQDSTDVWVPLAKCDLITPADVDDQVRKDFSGVDAKFRDRVRKQVYRCIQANQDPPAGVSPVMTRFVDKDLKFHPIQVRATIAQRNSKGVWRNSFDDVDVQVVMKTDEDVLILDQPLVKVKGHTYYPAQDFDGPANFTVRYSYEDYTEAKDGTQTPKFSHFGFSAGANGGFPDPLSDSDAENAIDGGKDAILLLRPQWWIAHVDGSDVNKSKIMSAAKSEAELHLRNATSPQRILSARGFASVALSGLVTEVSWDQQALKTTIKTADSYSPLGAMQGTVLREIERGAAEAFPAQGESQASKTALGQAGSQQPVYYINPAISPPSPPSVRLVQVSDFFKGGGFYGILDSYGSPQQMGQDAIDGKNLTMPENLKVATTDQKKIGVHFAENGMNTHFLARQSWQLALSLGNYTKGNQTTEVLGIVSNNCITVKIGKAIEPYSVGNPKGSGGYYNGHSISGGPQKLPDPTQNDLTVPEAGEKLGSLKGNSLGDLLIENLRESGYNDPPSHWIPPDYVETIGMLTGYMSQEDPPRPIVRVSVPMLYIQVKITTPASDGGIYNGNEWVNNAPDHTAGSALAEADLGTAAGMKVMIYNRREVGKNTHDLVLGDGSLPQVFAGLVTRINADGTPCVSIDGFQWEDGCGSS